MQAESFEPGLLRCAQEVLEESVFILAEPTDEPSSWSESVIEASIPFTGPANGVVTLAATEEFGSSLAANLLGIEPDELANGEGGTESIAELLNILMGVLSNEWFGDAECDFGLPEVKVKSAAEFEADRAKSSVSLSLVTDEDDQLDLAIFLADE